MAQRLIPGAGYVWETGSAQRLIPGLGYVLEAEGESGNPTVIDCSVGALSVSGQAASVFIAATIESGIGVLVGSGLKASVVLPTTVAANLGFVASQGLKADVSLPVVIDCSIDNLALTGLQAGIDIGTTINAGVGMIALVGLDAEIVGSTSVHCAVGQAGCLGLPASIEIVTSVDCDIGELLSTGLPADIAIGTTIHASIGALAVTGLAAAIVVTSQGVRPNPARIIVVPARQLKILIPARVRHYIVRGNMIYQAESKRPDESPVFSLDIRKELALTDDTISSVATDIEVETGTDDNVASMCVGDPAATGTIVSQRVGGGISGNVYNLKFEVTTPHQVLAFVMKIPVDDDGAFA